MKKPFKSIENIHLVPPNQTVITHSENGFIGEIKKSCHCEESRIYRGTTKQSREEKTIHYTRLPRLHYISARNDIFRTLAQRERAENQCELESIRFSGEGIAEDAQTKVEPSPAFVTHFVRTTATSPDGRGKKAAFTLSEMLTTLAVIGVIAMLSIPILFNNTDDKVLEKQRQAFTYKFNDGLEEMKIDDKLSANYSSTEEFVNVMKKYFKITSICDNNNLQKCFPKEFTYTDEFDYKISYTAGNTRETGSFSADKNNVNTTFTTANLKTTADIASAAGVNARFRSNVMGIVFSDDIRMLIAYNPNCTGPTTLDNVDSIADMTKCISYIADINADKAPNEVKRDIITNMQLANMGFEIASAGVMSSSVFGCLDGTSATGYEKSSYTCDYWLGAKRYCENLQEDGGGWSLPNANQLAKLAKAIYLGADCSIGTYEHQAKYTSCKSNLVRASEIWQALNGSSTSTLYLRSNTKHGTQKSYIGYFKSSGYEYGYANTSHTMIDNASAQGICVR